MRKIFIALAITLTLSACGERESVSKLRQICEEDIKQASAEFDCDCQIDIFKESLSDEQLDLLAKFITTERSNKEEAFNISKEPGFDELFRVLVAKAPEIEQKCRKAAK